MIYFKKRTRVRSEKDSKEPVSEDKKVEQTENSSDPVAEETDKSETNEPKYEPEEQVPAAYANDVDLVIFHNGEFVLVREAFKSAVILKNANPYDYFNEIGFYRCFLHFDDVEAFARSHICYFNSHKEIVYINMLEYCSLWQIGYMFVGDNYQYNFHFNGKDVL